MLVLYATGYHLVSKNSVQLISATSQLHALSADQAAYPLWYMCPEKAVSPSSNKAYYADTSTDRVAAILCNTQDKAQ